LTPGDFEDLTEEEQQNIVSDLQEVVLALDPIALREDIQCLDKLVGQARVLKKREIESRLVKLRQVLNEQHIFSDLRMKFLIFTSSAMGGVRLSSDSWSRRASAGRLNSGDSRSRSPPSTLEAPMKSDGWTAGPRGERDLASDNHRIIDTMGLSRAPATGSDGARTRRGVSARNPG